MKMVYVNIWKFSRCPPLENQLSPVSLIFFYISPVNSLNLSLIPGAKLDGHRHLDRVYRITRFFYRQRIYKQCQAEIGKKSSKS